MYTSVIIIDDDAIVRESVRMFLEAQSDIEVIQCFGRAEDYLAELAKNQFEPNHILLVDIGLPGLGGLEAIPEIKQIADPDIIMLSTYEEEDKILKALSLGATSYISKRAGLKAILEGIQIVQKGGAYLSPAVAREVVGFFAQSKRKKEEFELPARQYEVLSALSEGRTYQEIANEMSISVETVRSHIKKMYRNMQVKNKVEAINLYMNGSVK
ncbi:response regulator transcription factor [Jiulongibacter sediminis]|jgi:DNA-binding NarL/FixJ family response regulator|uniref:response regulator n=1 Tax=Jiulongibacter sediminis TaxID=1605367 RepID=UPI0026F354EB|nr:response regulator transcription factor [Jiulongibacter sediminis]